MNYSIVQFIPGRSGHSCGYCKSNNGSLSEGMWAHEMTVQDYQDLIDRGWRRSGLYCYKPVMNVTCCPAYTIKCAALDFRLTKSQKKILKRIKMFLIDGKKCNVGESESTHSVEAPGEGNSEIMRLENISNIVADIEMKDVDTSMLEATQRESVVSDNIDNKVPPNDSSNSTILTNPSEPVNNDCVSENALASPSNKKKNCHSAHGRDSSKPLMKKAKLIRLERREKKQLAKFNSQGGDTLCHNSSCKKTEPQAKTLEEILNEPLPENRKHNLEIKLLESGTIDIELTWKLYAKYQMSIHKDAPEDCDVTSFREFLVSSPLKFKQDQSSHDIGYGSFHQQYWLDGKLIAVGVIDILPYCVSSVYFFYDPDYSFLSLGTYSSLREVALVRSLYSKSPLLKYYYMGFYIHSCPKMRYKGRIGPSFLLCPEIYSWHPIESCIPKLDENKYSRLSDDPNAASRDSDIDLNRVLILWKNIMIDFARYKRLCKKKVKTDEILHYAKLVGKTCAQRMLLYQSAT